MNVAAVLAFVLAALLVASAALVVGFDFGVVAALGAGAVGEGSLQWLLAASPNSAYRGLVIQTVLGAVPTLPTSAASVPANLSGCSSGWWGRSRWRS